MRWRMERSKARGRRSPGDRRSALPPRVRFRPQAEILEDRMLPSAGAVDPTFGQNGLVTVNSDAMALAIVVEGDGKIVVLDQSQAGYDILRLNADGSWDATFGDN